MLEREYIGQKWDIGHWPHNALLWLFWSSWSSTCLDLCWPHGKVIVIIWPLVTSLQRSLTSVGLTANFIDIYWPHKKVIALCWPYDKGHWPVLTCLDLLLTSFDLLILYTLSTHWVSPFIMCPLLCMCALWWCTPPAPPAPPPWVAPTWFGVSSFIRVFARSFNFFRFIRRFWNQTLTWRSVRCNLQLISQRFCRVM